MNSVEHSTNRPASAALFPPNFSVPTHPSGANIEESQGGQSRADFLSKISIAYKEARETHYWLRLLAASKLIPERDLLPVLDEANQLVANLTVIVRSTKRLAN